MRKLLPTLPIAPNVSTVCTGCGRCCETYPGIPSPEDFGAPDREVMRTKIRAALETGLWAVDWWVGDPRHSVDPELYPDGLSAEAVWKSYFFRPAMKGFEGETFHPGYGGACALLERGKGCTLEYNERPYNCRALVPMRIPETSCMPMPREDGTPVTKAHNVIAWAPYAALLEEIGAVVIEAKISAVAAADIERGDADLFE